MPIPKFEDEKTITQNLTTGMVLESKPESVSEVSAEVKEDEEQLIQGAEMLEEPYKGSFTSSLQLFVTWVNNILAKK
jgi:hypothetical protein